LQALAHLLLTAMTEAELKKEIAARTQIPESLVAHILDTESVVIAQCLQRGEEVSTLSIKLHSSPRTTQVLDPKTNERKEHTHVMVYVKPRAFLRKHLTGD